MPLGFKFCGLESADDRGVAISGDAWSAPAILLWAGERLDSDAGGPCGATETNPAIAEIAERTASPVGGATATRDAVPAP